MLTSMSEPAILILRNGEIGPVNAGGTNSRMSANDGAGSYSRRHPILDFASFVRMAHLWQNC